MVNLYIGGALLNPLSLLSNTTDPNYLAALKETLENRNLLDHDRNLSLKESTEQDFIEMFFAMKVFQADRPLALHTVKAYRSDAKTLLGYLTLHSLSFRDIGFPEVRAYSQFIRDKYAARSAIRKLEFFRRLLDFGYETQFYGAHLSSWISKPTSKKGHYIIEETRQEESQTRVQRRELSQADAESLISHFPKIVKTQRNREQLEKRNLLIGYLLYTTGLRASELLSLNWGSFRYSRKGHLFVDVIGKGKKPRTIPVREETKNILFEYRKSTGETTEIDPGDTSPLFYVLYNKEETSHRKKRLTYPALYKLVKAAIELAGKDKKISPHWFRHTFVTLMLENDVPLAVVKDWAGHSDISTTNMYLERVNQDKMHFHLDKVDIF
jgi:integrase/recombinase XerD